MKVDQYKELIKDKGTYKSKGSESLLRLKMELLCVWYIQDFLCLRLSYFGEL